MLIGQVVISVIAYGSTVLFRKIDQLSSKRINFWMCYFLRDLMSGWEWVYG